MCGYCSIDFYAGNSNLKGGILMGAEGNSVMEFPSFGSIDNEDISNISCYSYKHLDAYLNVSA